MERIEKAARAGAGFYGREFEHCPPHRKSWLERSAPEWWDCNTPTQEDHLNATRAAIEALIEPSEMIFQAAGYNSDQRQEEARIVLQAVLRAVLDEQPAGDKGLEAEK